MHAPMHEHKLPAWAKRAVPLALVCLAHAALVGWLTTTLGREPVRVEPPAVVGVLVSEAPATAEPTPLPAAPEPPPEPVQQPKPKPQPVPHAPRSERAVTPPPETEPAKTDGAPSEPRLPREPAPEAQAEPTVTPPRSDAAHLDNPAPVYPPLSKRYREQGRVLMDVYILPDGSVGEARLKASSGFPRLDEAALAAVRRWRYVPARRGDEPIPYWYVQPLEFELSVR